MMPPTKLRPASCSEEQYEYSKRLNLDVARVFDDSRDVEPFLYFENDTFVVFVCCPSLDIVQAYMSVGERKVEEYIKNIGRHFGSLEHDVLRIHLASPLPKGDLSLYESVTELMEDVGKTCWIDGDLDCMIGFFDKYLRNRAPQPVHRVLFC
jgi:hypothetical protein